MTNLEQQTEALDRARTGQALTNYPAIYSGFLAKGIAESDIKPRENIFTFNAWKALGRSVKKGEHGIKVVTFITCQGKADVDSGETEPSTYRRPHTTTVFHISQTELTSEREGRLGSKQWRRNAYDNAKSRRDDSWRNDPGEIAARWNETHGDRWIES